MFVPHEPYNCFDVYNPSDRCVCGCSAVATSDRGPSKGYCFDCSNKRDTFVNNIIGGICAGEEGTLEYSTLVALEVLRKSITKERLYYLVDLFFSQHLGERPFAEPYEDASFKAQLISEKLLITDTFLQSMQMSPKLSEKKQRLLFDSNVNNKIAKIYQYYTSELLKMKDIDMDELCYLDAEYGGYKYERKFSK